MEIVKCKSENGIKTVKIEREIKIEKPVFDWAKNEREIRERDRKQNEDIKEIFMEFLISEKDKDLEYIKSKEGCYERYIRTYWPEVLKQTERDKTIEKWQTVVFIEDGWNVRLIKNIKVRVSESGYRYGIVKGRVFNIDEPDEVADEIKMGINKGTRQELYMAVLKNNALVCDINKMLEW